MATPAEIQPMPEWFEIETTEEGGFIVCRHRAMVRAQAGLLTLTFAKQLDPAVNLASMDGLKRSIWQALELCRIGRHEELGNCVRPA